jgi:hypothetical protein
MLNSFNLPRGKVNAVKALESVHVWIGDGLYREPALAARRELQEGAPDRLVAFGAGAVLIELGWPLARRPPDCLKMLPERPFSAQLP